MINDINSNDYDNCNNNDNNFQYMYRDISGCLFLIVYMLSLFGVFNNIQVIKLSVQGHIGVILFYRIHAIFVWCLQ